MLFIEWLDGHLKKQTEDAVSYFAKWMKKRKKEKNIFFITAKAKENKEVYLKFIRKMKANKTVKMCFETAWFEYSIYKVRLLKSIDEPIDHRVGVGGIEFVEPIVVHTRKQFKSNQENGETEEDEVIAVRKFVVIPARIGARMSVTKNLGDYSSVTFGCNIEIPCYAEEIETAYERAKEFVSARVQNEFLRAVDKKKDVSPDPDLGLSDLSKQDSLLLP